MAVRDLAASTDWFVRVFGCTGAEGADTLKEPTDVRHA
jgi:catechol 2,3-dioxygenase-like lactoylglutathione lyase family enzyme